MNETTIQPIPIQRGGAKQDSKKPKKIAPLLFGFFLIVLLGLAAFVMLAQQITIQIDPMPDSLKLSGGRFPALHVGDSLLAWPGEYTLRAQREGYEDIETDVVVERKDEQAFEFSFTALPGELTLYTVPDLVAQVFHEELLLGKTPGPFELMGGSYALRIVAKDYVALETNVVVEGLSKKQNVSVALIPAWSIVHVESEPKGARVFVGDDSLGATPLAVELFSGEYHLKFSKAGFEEVVQKVTVLANTPTNITQALAPALGLLKLKSIPSRVGVQVDGQYRGQTPVELKLKPDVDHQVVLLEPGYVPYEQNLNLGVGEQFAHEAVLKPLTGILRLSSVPAGVEVRYKGEEVGVTPIELEVPCIQQELIFQAAGYETLIQPVHAKPGPAQRVHVKLVATAVPVVPAVPGEKVVLKVPEGTSITAANGYTLTMIPTAKFTMGSSRREQGRRANERLYEVEFNRRVYFGVHEVTNKEFEAFDPSHTSGLFKNKRLHGENQPVCAVKWEQAVAYCNWMSEQEGLPLAYKQDGDEWFAVSPINTGYRLPSEAEWEFCARYDGKAATRKYPWTGGLPPSDEGGNLADAFARSILSSTLKGYSDGQAVSCKVGSYTVSALGLFDLSGNVSEWCHDSYQIAVLPSDTVDPIGTGRGGLHVIRGSSWKQSTITELRCAARDYGDQPRVDLGFRVVRYAQ